jgi:hypothetical protein
MDVVKRLALASGNPSREAVRPNTETFLARVFGELGIDSPAVSEEGTDRAAAGPLPQADPEEGLAQEVVLPPTWEELLDELQEIASAAAWKEDGSRLRRIAEIVELLDGEEAAYAWWRHAAQAGDEVAVAVVEDLHLTETQGERPSALPTIDSLCSALLASGPGRGGPAASKDGGRSGR